MRRSAYLTVLALHHRRDKYEVQWREGKLLPHLPVLQAGSDTLTAIAILVIALGFVGLAILILFSKKKI